MFGTGGALVRPILTTIIEESLVLIRLLKSEEDWPCCTQHMIETIRCLMGHAGRALMKMQPGYFHDVRKVHELVSDDLSLSHRLKNDPTKEYVMNQIISSCDRLYCCETQPSDVGLANWLEAKAHIDEVVRVSIDTLVPEANSYFQ